MKEDALKELLKGVPVVILLGRTAAGKSTIADKVRRKTGFPSISIGEMARAEIAKGSELGKEVQSFVRESRQIPGDILIKMIKTKILSNPKKFSKGIVFAGVPVGIEAVPAVEKFFKDYGLQLRAVFHAFVPRKVSIARRKASPRGELGASPERREEAFQQEYLRVISHFGRRGLLKTFDATRSVAGNAEIVMKAFKRRRHRK
jgi:adenylate kinase